MPLRADSYGSIEGVRALTRHLLDGAANFSAQTRPTLAEVEAMIDRWSAALNVALINRDVQTPVAHETVRQVCDQWVIRQAAAEVELTQRGTGWSDDEGSRLRALRGANVDRTADSIAEALRRLGANAQGATHSGLTFTGSDKPIFARGQFDL